MKKTLVTVALAIAAATSAFAETASNTFSQPTYTLPSSWEQGTKYPDVASGANLSSADGSYQQFTLTAVLDWNAVSRLTTSTEAHAAVQILRPDNGTEDYVRSIGFKLDDSGSVVVCAMNDNDTKDGANPVKMTASTSSFGSYVYHDFGSGVDKLALTLVVNAEGSWLYAYNATSDTAVELATSESGMRLKKSFSEKSLRVSNTYGDAVITASAYNIAATTLSDITAISRSVLAIPEPATATLSLLALAGLVARRRRK